MKTLDASERLGDFSCPSCRSSLRAGSDAITCSVCWRAYPIRHGVVDYVLPEALSEIGRREHVANAVDLEHAKAVRRRVRKGEGNPMMMAQMRRSVRAAERLIGRCDTLVSLGSGAGFELRLLLERRTFPLVYSSDLAWSATALVPDVTGSAAGTLGLFAADFDRCPIVKRAGTVGFVFLALHHADNPYRSLTSLLERNFDRLVLVEPVTNRFIEALARVGLARRVEYSGTRPQWLDLRRLEALAHAHGRSLEVETWWELPRDRLPARLRRHRRAWWPILAASEAVSRVTRPFRFGSMAAIRFE